MTPEPSADTDTTTLGDAIEMLRNALGAMIQVYQHQKLAEKEGIFDRVLKEAVAANLTTWRLDPRYVLTDEQLVRRDMARLYGQEFVDEQFDSD